MANCKITEDEARNRIMRQLKYAPDKKGGSGRKPKSNGVETVLDLLMVMIVATTTMISGSMICMMKLLFTHVQTPICRWTKKSPT